ncbi:hypothetical protein PCE1_004180 [Barthelona sp. PCE]
MPRSISRHSEKFSFSCYADNILVRSTDERLNTVELCFIDKHMEGAVQSSPVNPCWIKSYVSYRLRPTLLEGEVFYRTLYINSETIKIELFQFMERNFILVENFIVPRSESYSSEGVMINSRLWMRICFGDSIDLVDLKQDQKTVLSMPLPQVTSRSSTYSFFVQDEVAYLVDWAEKKILQYLLIIDNLPFLIKKHPLKDVIFFAIDRTPGDNRFIIEQNGHYCYCKVEDDNVIYYNVTASVLQACNKRYRNSFLSNFTLEIVRVYGSTVINPDQVTHYGEIFCENWNFVSIAGELFCTEYDSFTGSSTFYPVFKHQVKGLFAVHSKLIGNCAFTPPIHFDFYNGTCTMLISSLLFENCTLMDYRREYDIRKKKWCNLYLVVEDFKTYNMYTDDLDLLFQLECYPCDDIMFNKDHLLYTNNLSTYINARRLNDVDNAIISGNFLWYSNYQTINILFLCKETGCLKFCSHTLEGRIESLTVNPFANEEIFVETVRIGICLPFFFRYKVEDNKLIICRDMEVFTEYNVRKCFIDKSVFIYKNIIHAFKTSNVDTIISQTLELELGSLNTKNVCRCHSPAPGVFVMQYSLDAFNVRMHIYTFDNFEIEHEQRDINIIEFLMTSEITTFEAFSVIEYNELS